MTSTAPRPRAATALLGVVLAWISALACFAISLHALLIAVFAGSPTLALFSALPLIAAVAAMSGATLLTRRDPRGFEVFSTSATISALAGWFLLFHAPLAQVLSALALIPIMLTVVVLLLPSSKRYLLA